MADHVGLEHYLAVRRGKEGAGELLRRMHRHVLEGCPECRRQWEALVGEEKADLGELLAGERGEVPFDPAPPPPRAGRPARLARYATAFSSAAEKVNEAATALQWERTMAQRNLAKLLSYAPSQRRAALRRSRQRFRSPALAMHLVQEARTRVRRSPAEALELLNLVRPVLEIIPGALGQEWAVGLELVASALRANALRVSGDLNAADRAFRDTRRMLARAELADPAPIEAEVASLEASLRRDQRRYDEAAVLLDRAVLLYEAEGETEGLARALIQRADIRQLFEQHEAALVDLEQARGLVHHERQPFLHLLAVVSSVPTLLDIGRARDAERVLAMAAANPATGEPWWRLRILHLRGRIALALLDLERAAHLLTGVREGSIELGLPYDTAAATLELAVVALYQGDTRRVRELAREIAPLFEGCGVVREALAALALFEKAKRADAPALALAAALRRHLAAAQVAGARRPEPPAPS